MYQIYNCDTGLYGIIYHKLKTAKAMAHAYSLWVNNARHVVDMATGEIMAIYESGLETYVAEG